MGRPGAFPTLLIAPLVESLFNAESNPRIISRGLFDEAETVKIALDLKPLLQPCVVAAKGEAGVLGPREVAVRPLLCSPERRACRDNQPWLLCGGEMFAHIAKCLNPEAESSACSTRYDFNSWGFVAESPCTLFQTASRESGRYSRFVCIL